MSNALKIVKGDDFSAIIQLGNEPGQNKGSRLILSSTADNPAKVFTMQPHGLINGQAVRIRNHSSNLIINGNQIVTVTDATSFTVPVAGQIAGLASGSIMTTIDATSMTVTLSLRKYHGAADLVTSPVCTPSLAWGSTRNIFRFTVSLTELQTAALPIGTLHLAIVYVSGSVTKTKYIPLSVTNG